MKVLIIYATVEGQTGKIARFAEDLIRSDGHEVVLLNVSDVTTPPSFEEFDRVILAASVHERRHDRDFEVMLAANRSELEAQRTLLLSVSLSAAFPEGLEEAGEYVVELKMRTGFTPSAEMLVAGAVHPGEYDYFASEVVRQVVLRDRHPEVEPGDDHEFTDWDALSRGLKEFLSD